jgi:hypothetical protein
MNLHGQFGSQRLNWNVRVSLALLQLLQQGILLTLGFTELIAAATPGQAIKENA